MSRHFLLPVLLILLAVPSLLAKQISSEDESVSGRAIIREMNLARQNPALYASYVEEMRSHLNGRILLRPGRANLVTKEGMHAIDDAVRFLRSVQPLQPLTLSPGMCRGAADHCADQAGGSMGHSGRDGSNPGGRISRYGTWSLSWGENVAYGKTTARDVVLALIIDDGVRSRGHRKNIFNPNFNCAGAAYGPHALYRSVCTTDFAGGFAERGQTVAQNF
jgi:uncharacterized protein YkwD